jgi:predicted permease
MESAAWQGYSQRRVRGRSSAIWFALRALADFVVTGAAERRRDRTGWKARWRVLGLRDAGTDLRVAARTLLRAPGFSAAAVAVLALGVGVNTAIFSAVRATLLQAPPYPDSERIVFLGLTDSSTVRGGPTQAFPWSYPKFQALGDVPDLPLDATAAYARRSLSLTGIGAAAYLAAEFVTPGYLGILGRSPGLGRDFDDGDDVEGGPMVVILAHALWLERFGGDTSVLGRTVTLNGRTVEVIGVAPAGFRGLTGQASLWVPVNTGAALTAPFLVRGAQAHWLRAIGRLTSTGDVAALDERMRVAGASIEALYPDSDPTVVRGGQAESFAQALVNPQARTSLLVLAAAGLLLLLVACANLAGLLLARAHARGREAAVRVALGAGRWRVARTFLAEALLLAGVGGLAGVGVARAGVAALGTLWPTRFVESSWQLRAPGVDAVGLDPWVLAFAASVAVGSGLLFGVLPALSVGQAEPAARLRAGVHGPTRRARPEARALLVTGEMALALVLLVGAGLLLRSLGALQQVERGFDPQGLVTFDIAIPRGSRWDDQAAAFHERYLERLRALPGVQAAALGCVAPLSGHCMITGVRTAGGREWSEGSRPAIGVHYVSDDFFATLGIPVLEGRTFSSLDQADSPPVVVLSRSAAEGLFADGRALGEAIEMGTGLTPQGGAGAEVVGVVGDVLFDRPANGTMHEVFVSHRQEEGGSTVFLKVAGEPLGVVPGARAALAELDPDVPLFGVRTVSDLEAAASGDTRILSQLLAGFAALALLLACTGVWAVVTFAVTRRTREIGLRLALGADAGSVVRTVLRQGLVLSGAGLAVGGLGAWAGTRLLGSVLFGVGTADPWSFAGASAVLLAVATLASWIPARRATRVDPMVALRAD